MEAEAAEEEEVEEAGYKIKNKNPTQNQKIAGNNQQVA